MRLEDWHQESLKKIQDLLKVKTGIEVQITKIRNQVGALQDCMERHGFRSVRSYIAQLQTDRDPKKIKEIAELFLIHETYFFREFRQLQFFSEYLLQCTAALKVKQKDPLLRVWSAACSTGDEVYTLAIILKEMVEHPDILSKKVLGTDMDPKSIDIAREGIYAKRNVESLPAAYAQKYIQPLPDQRFQVRSVIRQMVEFEVANLFEIGRQSEYRNIDFIFCRNVLIYFGPDHKRTLLDIFYHSLRPGGVLLIGMTDSLVGVEHPFETRSEEGLRYFQKPGG